ncbi:hypothetical protein PFISCL1PPCAC_22233, partial [Pristionchus fissidentatus]
ASTSGFCQISIPGGIKLLVLPTGRFASLLEKSRAAVTSSVAVSLYFLLVGATVWLSAVAIYFDVFSSDSILLSLSIASTASLYIFFSRFLLPHLNTYASTLFVLLVFIPATIVAVFAFAARGIREKENCIRYFQIVRDVFWIFYMVVFMWRTATMMGQIREEGKEEKMTSCEK